MDWREWTGFAAVQLLGVVWVWSGPRILSGPGPVPFGVGLVLLASLPQDPVVIRIVRRDGPDSRDRQAASGSRLGVGSGGGGTACRRKTAISFGPASG